MTMLDVTVKTSLVLAVGMLVTSALHRRSAALRHWVLASAIACAAAIPLLAHAAPSWSLPHPSRPAFQIDRTPDVAFRVDRQGLSHSSSPADVAAQPSTARSVIAAVALRGWIAGSAINLIVLLIGMWRLNRLGTPRGDVDAAIAAAIDRVSSMLGVRRRLVLVCSTQGAILTWGVIRPTLVLPASAAQWPRERLDLVLAHEMAHIARADWLVQILAEVVKAIYWFNPLFWVACARVRHESERACDDAVVNTGVASHVYAVELLELARSVGRHREPWLPAPAIAARASNLERRVRAMLNAGIDRKPVTSRARWVSAVALLTVALPIATFAQGGFATFSGTVVDPQDRVLPTVTITVVDAARGVKHETKTDRNGHFELIGLPAGDYAVDAKLPGFRNLSDTFTLNGQSLDRTFTLQVGELQETITVVSDDGSVTNARQSENVATKRPNPVCAADAANDIGGTIRPPHKVKDVRPGYPGVSGDVQLAATIGTDGSVTDVQVVKADRPELAAAASDAVRQWEFDSTLLNCVPVEVHMNVNISFRQNR